MKGKLVKTSLIVAVLSSLVIPPALLGLASSQVSAADPPEFTEILRPNAPGDQCSIVSQIGEPCPNHYLNVDDVTPDEDATVVRESWLYTSTHTDLYNIEDTSVGRGAINKVTVYARCRRQSGYAYAIDFWVVLKTHGTVYSQKFSYLGTSYTNLSHSWTSNPFTGQPWT